jgi:hypothetical protein
MTSIDPARPFGETVILEMKFSNGKPRWFSDIERVLGLERTSAAKYCDGILTRGIERFSPEGGMSPLASGERELGSVDEKRAKRFATLSGIEGTGLG